MLQGVGAAVMLPASLALLSHAFPDARARARAVAFWASIVSLGFAAGPALGGVLTSAFGWRSIFLINIPVGVLALMLVRGFVDETPVTRARHIDWAGQATASLVLCAVTYALIEAGRSGWTAPRILVALGAALLLATVFALVERRSVSPVLPPHLFANPAFSVCVAVAVVLGFGMYGTLFVESVRLQNVRHLSALTTGLMIVPFTVAPTITTRAIDRFDGGLQVAPGHRSRHRRRWRRDDGGVDLGNRLRPDRGGSWTAWHCDGLHHARDDGRRIGIITGRDVGRGIRHSQRWTASGRVARRGVDGNPGADAGRSRAAHVIHRHGRIVSAHERARSAGDSYKTHGGLKCH
jgi:hypothetical protein